MHGGGKERKRTVFEKCFVDCMRPVQECREVWLRDFWLVHYNQKANQDPKSCSAGSICFNPLQRPNPCHGSWGFRGWAPHGSASGPPAPEILLELNFRHSRGHVQVGHLLCERALRRSSVDGHSRDFGLALLRQRSNSSGARGLISIPTDNAVAVSDPRGL